MMTGIKQSNDKKQHEETNLYAKKSSSNPMRNCLVFLELIIIKLSVLLSK